MRNYREWVADVTTFAPDIYVMFAPEISVTLNVTIPCEMDAVDVMVALPAEPVTPVLPDSTIPPVKSPVTVALLTSTPAESFTFTTARDRYRVPEAKTQLIVMLFT